VEAAAAAGRKHARLAQQNEFSCQLDASSPASDGINAIRGSFLRSTCDSFRSRFDLAKNNVHQLQPQVLTLSNCLFWMVCLWQTWNVQDDILVCVQAAVLV